MKILIAGISVRAIAESAVRSGYEVVALDAFGDRDLTELTESASLRRDMHTAYSPEALLEASRKLAFDAVAYTSNLENYPGILAAIGNSRPIIGNNPEAVRSVRDWPGFFGSLRESGFPVPETVFRNEPPPSVDGRRWLAKPLRSGGGRGIRFHDPATPLREPGTMLQEYIPGRSCSAAFVADGGNCVLLGITEQLIGLEAFGCGDFRYCGNLLPLPEAAAAGAGKKLLEMIRRLALSLTRDHGLTGVDGIDFILRDGRVYPTEVNPRYSASMELIEIAYGLPVFRLHLEAALHGSLPEFDLEAALESGGVFGKACLFAEKDIAVPDTDGWRERGIRDIPHPGETIRTGGPVCTLLASGPTREGTLGNLMRCAEALKESL